VEFEFWGVMLLVYSVGYYLREFRRLRKQSGITDPGDSHTLSKAALHKTILATTLRCVAVSMAALMGLHIVDSNPTDEGFDQ
jgi:hypothetical protein